VWTGLAVVLLMSTLAACDTTPGPAAFRDSGQFAKAVSGAMSGSKSTRFGSDITAGGVQTKGQGQARLDNGGTALALAFDFFGEPLNLRLLGQALYAQVPEAAREDVGSDKPWVKVPPGGNDPFSLVLGGSLVQLAEQNDPVQTLDQITRAGKLVKSEQTQLDGKPATHYWFDIELAKLGDELPAGVTPDVVKQLQGKVGTYDLEVWLDAHQLPTETLTDLTPMLKAAGAPDGSGAKITTTYTGWGTPVDVQAPPPGQVGTITPHD
jgi:hypothetical protein